MMKLLSSLLPSIAILSCFSADVSVHAKTIEGDVQLQLLVGLETRLDHSEMNRIFSTPNHRRHLKADKVALAEKAKAHIGTCLQLYHLSIDDHNKSKKGVGGLEIIPLAKDGSRFYLSGSVKDFVSYFKKGGDNGSFFISFKETSNEKNQVTITANYEDGQTAKKFSEELEECTGFIGTFQRRRNHNIDQVEIGRNGESENENESRVLQRILSTEELSGFCPLSTEAVKKFAEENPTGDKGFPAANAETIRNMYGVPSLDGTCYKPRDSAVYGYGGVIIGADDLTCYNQINGLQNTVVEPVSIDNEDLFSPPFGSPFGTDTPNGICKLPKCICASKEVSNLAQTDGQNETLSALKNLCVEPNIDVQMISAVSGGTTIRSLSYSNDDPTSVGLSTYEDLLIQLTKLEEDEHPPAVISISYGSCYDPSALPENEKQLVEICKNIGMVTMKTGITFFVASGDGGAYDSNNGVCGVYCQNAFTACPYVTSVGGSFGSEGGTEVLSIGEPAARGQGKNVVSGGGFSKIFSVANGFDLSYQAAAVKSWRQQPNATLSLPGYENADGTVGAGFPDVSAKSDNIEIFVGLFPITASGTSASSPIFAGIVNLCASQLDDDQAGFGWINPDLYQNPDLFFDIIGDNNSNDLKGESCPPPPVNEICPAANFIAKAYLTYDGSLGETVFVDIQTTGTSFVSRTVAKDESIAFGFDVTSTDSSYNFTLDNFKDVSIIISDLDPDQGGSTIISKTLSTACPGSWTIGSTIVSGFVLNGFLNYDLDLPFTPVANVEANGKFFGFEATDGWDPASGLGTIGTVDQNDPNKGFRGLCKVLLGKPFDFEKIQCTIPTAVPAMNTPFPTLPPVDSPGSAGITTSSSFKTTIGLIIATVAFVAIL